MPAEEVVLHHFLKCDVTLHRMLCMIYISVTWVSDITLHHFLSLLQVMIVMELLEKGDLRSYLLTVE